MKIIITALLLATSLAFAQDDSVVTERGVPTQIAPGVTIIIDPETDVELEVAEEVYAWPSFVRVEIPYDKMVTSFNIELSSKVTTHVIVELSETENAILRGNDEVRLPAGARVSVGATAYAPHTGTISVYNTEDVLLAMIPYEVVRESRFRQTIGANVSTSATTDMTSIDYEPINLSVGYAVREKETGITGSVTFDFDGADVGFSGSVSGQYSW